ncbi:STM4014 family protein [Deinococcus pimensis]|uniref:STM4014 family protein n=1 Tax=Deinococcus pimensis TaxID=309888 RepID=UPI0004AE40A6|nr:STM4014 family protein [Deinococcus pimensis]
MTSRLGAPREVLIVAPPASRRVRAFQQTLREHGWPSARVVSYLDVLHGQVRLRDEVRAGSVVRLDSPGEDPETEAALLRLGAPRRDLPVDLAGGELLPARPWYRGLGLALDAVERELRGAAPHLRMQTTNGTLAMFDKRVTHARLAAAGVSVPEALGEVTSFDGLMEGLASRGWARVFVKLAHGSSASGAVALELASGHVQATTTVEVVRSAGGVKLYNSRRLLRVRGVHGVRELIDALVGHGLHVERWVPKAGLHGRVLDLRVVVIAGRARHVLVRLGRGSMTNLHLGGDRGDVAEVRDRLGEERWTALLGSAEAALACFPGSLYAGVDVLVTPNWRRHVVCEVNAFGDYHRGVLHDGLDTYGAELAALTGGAA